MFKVKKINHLLVAATAALSIIGCGEILETVEDRPTPPPDPVTVNSQYTGHYLDENVSGIHYYVVDECTGDAYNHDQNCTYLLTGTTDETGKFGFLLGKQLHFSVAGLYLDTVYPKYLIPNAIITVPEYNSKLASFLQSMDSDGNATNGITITDEIVQALEDLNVSQYYSVYDIDIEALVTQVQEKLDAADTETEPDDTNGTVDENGLPQKTSAPLAKSTVSLRYVNEEEALAHLRATISKYKPVPSTTVEKVMDDFEALGNNAQNYTVEEIQESINAIRDQLDTPLAGDRNLRDIEIVKALVDLSELTNQEYLQDVLTFKYDTGVVNQMSQMIKEISFEEEPPLDEKIVLVRETDAENIVANTKTASTAIATNLKNISDKLGNALATVPQYYQFAYRDMNLSIDNLSMLRVSLLTMASKLSYSVARDMGTDEDYIKRTYTDEAGGTHEYTNVDIYGNEMLNREGFGVANDQTLLTQSKTYLTEALRIIKDLEAYHITAQEFDPESTETTNTADIQKAINYATQLYTVLSDNNGTFTFTAEGDEDNKTITIDINKLYNVATAPKPSDIGTEWEYTCPDEDNTILSSDDESKLYDGRYCYYPEDQNNYWWGEDNAEVEPKIKATAETSSLDELIVKIVVNGEEKTGQALIDYLFEEDEDTGSTTPAPAQVDTTFGDDDLHNHSTGK